MSLETAIADLAAALNRIASALEKTKTEDAPAPAPAPRTRAATPKPPPAPVPEPEVEDTAPEPTTDTLDLNAIMAVGTQVLDSDGGRACLKAISEKVGVQKISLADPKHYPLILKMLKAHLAQLGGEV